jgi:DNA processing protein
MKLPDIWPLWKKNKMDNTTKDLLLLNSIVSFGYKKLKILLQEFSSTKEIVKSVPSSDFHIKDIEEEIGLIEEHNVNVVTIFDKRYPDSLKRIDSPPIVLYVKGNIDYINEEKMVAVVGSRNCTYYGKNTASRICATLAKLGISVVSGMARGIDTTAHKEALNARGRTIAVLGSGLNDIYPPENKRLSETIASGGAIISEFSMNMPPLKENFPRRNRIISAMSKGVVVIEAPQDSGALITANFALEQGKDVFAVPGNADLHSFKGCNKLIKEGAKITCDALDIVEELFPELLDRQAKEPQRDAKKEAVLLNIAAEDRKIYELLKNEPMDIDSLIEEVKLSSPQVLSSLLNLELSGLVKQLPGKLYIKA